MLQSTLYTKNQFGEPLNLSILGGSSALWCSFVVDQANGNGLGCRSLKGNGVANVFMHTSATPAANNPNPVAGNALIQLAANYAGYNNGTYGWGVPVSGTPINVTAGLTVGHTYIITSVGTTSAAAWQALGLNAGLVPTVGQSFVAVTAVAGTGTGVVEAPATAGIDNLALVGDPNQMVGATGGALILVQFQLSNTVTQPTDGTVIGLTFDMIPLPGELI